MNPARQSRNQIRTVEGTRLEVLDVSGFDCGSAEFVSRHGRQGAAGRVKRWCENKTFCHTQRHPKHLFSPTPTRCHRRSFRSGPREV